jgi:hypothetical protein
MNISNFYNYENRNGFIKNKTNITTLKFVHGVGEFSLILLLEYEDGVDNPKLNVGQIVDAAGIKSFPEITDSKEEYLFNELFFDYESSIFFVWFVTIWQNSNLYSCGLKINISDPQCSTFFYLNDLAWEPESIISKETDYPIKSFFNRKLTPFEIFVRFKMTKKMF